MGSYQFVFEINGRKAGVCSSISGLDQIGQKVQPGRQGMGDLSTNPGAPTAALLLPAVQKVREAARRSSSDPASKWNDITLKTGFGGVPDGTSNTRVKWNDITLRHGATAGGPSPLILHGFKAEPGGPDWVSAPGRLPQPRTGVLTLRDYRDRPVARWEFINAWPAKISGPQPRAASGNEVGMEELTLVFESVQRTL